MSASSTTPGFGRALVRGIEDDLGAFAGASRELSREPIDFETYCGRKTLLFGKLVLLIVAACLILFLPTDAWLYAHKPGLTERLLSFRLVVAALLLVTYIGLQRLNVHRFDPAKVVFALFLLLTTFVFGYVGLLSGPETPLVYQAVFVPTIVSVFLVPLGQRIAMTLLSVLFAGIAYYAPHPEYFSHPNTGLLMVLMVADAIACTVAGHIVFQLERVGFARNRENREHAERLEELNRMKDSFVATVSHELRTPLNAIIGLTDALLDEELTPEPRRYARTIHESGEMLMLLINDILDLARLKADRMELELIPISIQDLVEASASSFGVACQKKHVELSYYVPMDIPLVMGDPARLSRILFNLIGNAVKFTETGEIQVIAGVERNGATPQLVISVSDTGVGVPVEKRDLIFEEFTQADPSITRRFGGTGLGLPIVRRLARLMNGDVTIADNQPRGSVFTLRTPIAFATPGFGVVTSVPETVPRSAPLVIVGMASPLRRRHVAGVVAARGLRVELAASFAEALRAAQDVKSEGKAVAAFIVEDPTLSLESLKAAELSMPLILILDGAQSRDAAKFREAGVAQVLQSPARRVDLRECLQRIAGPGSGRGESGLSREKASGRGGQSRRKRILVVEDMPENRLLIEAFLKHSPVDVVFAEDGMQALSKFQTTQFDLAFVDIEMPVMDGYTTARKMREFELLNGRTPIDIVALTAHSSKDYQARSKKAGFTYHLVKPLRKQELLAVTEILGEGEETLLMQAIAATAQ